MPFDAETTRAQGAESILTASVNGKVSKTGDTMSGPLTVQSGAAANVGLTVLGAGVTQSKNLQEWYNGGVNPVAFVAPTGLINLNAITFPDGTTQTTALVGAGAGVPSGYSILGDTTSAPAGYTYTGSSFDAGWQMKAAMPTARRFVAGGVISGTVYVVGGVAGADLAVNEAFNPSVNQWTTMAAMPTAREQIAAGVVNGKLYVIGGAAGSPLAVNEAYDPVANSWATKAAMPTARFALGVGVANGKLYAIGGTTTGGTTMTTNEQYDPVSNTWSTKAALPNALLAPAVVSIGNLIYVIGGYNGGPLNSVLMYDSSLNTWTTLTSMPTPRWALAADVVNGKILAIGGWNTTVAFTTCEQYDPATNSWSTKPAFTARAGLVACAVGNAIYAIGGSPSQGTTGQTNINEMYGGGVFYVHRRN